MSNIKEKDIPKTILDADFKLFNPAIDQAF